MLATSNKALLEHVVLVSVSLATRSMAIRCCEGSPSGSCSYSHRHLCALDSQCRIRMQHLETPCAFHPEANKIRVKGDVENMDFRQFGSHPYHSSIIGLVLLPSSVLDRPRYILCAWHSPSASRFRQSQHRNVLFPSLQDIDLSNRNFTRTKETIIERHH